ncbi:MAG: MBL fold metallo-hydrolase [Rhodoferax sp.]|nr:MBL fold metallo-hydrolase [Rhodoferax sp.]
MNDLERQLHYPLGEALPPPGEPLDVVAGADTGLSPAVKWVRMPLPFVLNHINLWLLRDEIDPPSGQGAKIQGWSIVDCCISNDTAKQQWESIFANALDGMPILRVIVTHMHPDHIGLAHWLCQRWKVPLWISATDYNVARIGCMGPTGFGGERAAEFFASHGLNSPEAVAQITARTGYFPALVPSVPLQYRRLMDGMVLRIGGRDWECISGYGHAPEHIALYSASLKVLIGGDMMLPRISTNVSVYEADPEANSLAQFLESIDKFRALPSDTLVLPSHGKPFTGLHIRIDQLHDHHRDRLSEVIHACTDRACSAADIVPVLFTRTLDLHQTTFAMGESIAHLHALWFSGKLRRTLGDDGVFRFRRCD